MEAGYVVVRSMIPPAELETLRSSVDAIVTRAPDAGRVTMTDWVDRQSAAAVELCFDDRVFDFSRQLMEAPDAAPLGMWVLCASGTGWHRDIHPHDMAPLDGLQEDIRLNGPPYVQWNIALIDDSYLRVMPGSHLRRNNADERQVERSQGVVPLPGAKTVDLAAGDGVVYINNILHCAESNGNEKRRTLHLGYQAFGGRGFTHFFLPATMGVHFIEHLSPWAAEKCVYFERLHAQRHDDVAADAARDRGGGRGRLDGGTGSDPPERARADDDAGRAVESRLSDSQIQRREAGGQRQRPLHPDYG